jgi:hypothetical protein
MSAVHADDLGRMQPTTIDLSRINGDDWQLLCVFGGYTDPVRLVRKEASERGIDIRTMDLVFPLLFQPEPVAEGEAAISFVDREGRGRTIMIRHGSQLIDYCACFGRETKAVSLPIKNAAYAGGCSRLSDSRYVGPVDVGDSK